jgi:replicative DNA helicase
MAIDELKSEHALPFSEDAEKAVLGAVLRDPDTLVSIEALLRVEHFFSDAHRKIFASILELSAANEVADILTVADKLRGASAETERLGPAYLVELTESCPVTQNIEHYAAIVRTDYYRRRIIAACQETIIGARSFEGSVEGFVERIEKEFLKIAGEYDRKGIVLADAVLDATIEDIQRRMENEDKITGIPTGFADLDGLTGGMQRSDLIILAARPGMGKTALVLNMAANAAKSGNKTVIFTLEMSKEQLMMRILSSEAQVDSGRLRKGDLASDEQDRLIEGARRMYAVKENLGIDETPSITLSELRSRCRRHHKEYGLDLVIIDYLQLMGSSSTRKMESREREISEISMGLKALAKELQVPVIALAQLNRGPDARPDKRPKISDLRESGSLEQDADLILFVYRDEYYNPQSEDQGIAEINVAKNRHGESKKIKVAYHPNYVAFKDLFQGGAPQPNE